MPRRSRGTLASGSSTSVPKFQRSRPAYVPLERILIEANEDEELPEFDAANTEIWTLDGTECVDLLESNLRGPFQVVGTLQLRQDQTQFLLKGAGSKSQDFESSITAYAIDANPDAEIWVGTSCGWIKLDPSPQYRSIFTKMVEAITVMYSCFDMEDNFKEAKRILKIETLPSEYALQNGTGLTKESAVELFKLHAKHTMAHIYSIPDMKRSKLFMWLKQTFPDTYLSVAEQTKTHLARQSAQAAKQVLPIRQPPPPRERSPTPELEDTPESTSSSPSCIEVSAEIGLDPKSGVVDLSPAQVMLEIISSQDPTGSNFSAQSLANVVYQDWSIWYPRLAAAIVRLHAPAVIKQLPKEWKKTKLAESLHEVAKLLTPAKRDRELEAGRRRGQRRPRSTVTCNAKAITDDEWLEEAAEYRTILRRNKKQKPKPTTSNSLGAQMAPPEKKDTDNNNASKTGDGGAEEQQISSRAERRAAHQAVMETITSRSRTPTPDIVHIEKSQFKTPHSQKSLPPTIEAKPSGKITQLKPKTVKRPRDDSDDEPHHKRPRRQGSIGSDSDVEMLSPSASVADESPSTSASESTSEAEELDTVEGDTPAFLPKELNMARGPMGSLRCTSPSCFFIERQPETRDGQARMLNHFIDHEKEDPTVVLARREAELNRRPVSYLMDKLRERGDQLDSKGRVIPLPIVRNGV